MQPIELQSASEFDDSLSLFEDGRFLRVLDIFILIWAVQERQQALQQRCPR